jgi:CBS domain-containing protein
VRSEVTFGPGRGRWARPRSDEKEEIVKIVDATRRSAIGIEPDRTVAHAAQLMEQAGVGALVVLDGSSVVGMVTDRDLVRRALARGLPADARIDAVMTTPVVTVDADADLQDAFRLFGTSAVRRIPVVRDGRFVGMFTIDDALVAMARDFGDLVRPVTAELLFAHRDPQLPAIAAS